MIILIWKILNIQDENVFSGIEVDLEKDLEPLSKEIHDKNMKFRNIEKIFKKIVKNSQEIGNINSEISSENKKDVLEEKLKSNRKAEMNLEDLIFNQTAEEILNDKKGGLNAYKNNDFLVTEQLQEHLKNKWDEDK